MADQVDGENIDKTMKDLQEANKHNEKLVSKITTKTCTRPPFRFLQDNIKNLIQHYNYHPDLYGDDELNPKTKMEKEAKVAFLKKIVDVVAGDFPQMNELDIKPSKICAGKECEKTRAFIQYLCLAATGAAAGEDAAATAENEEAKEEAKEEVKTEEPKAEAQEEAKKDESAPAEAKTEESAPAPAAASSGSAEFGFSLSDVDQSEENIPKTIEILSFVEKPKPSEKLLKRPPFRYLHDMIISILTSQSYHQDLYEGDELVAKGMDKPSKLAFLAKIKDTVSADLGMDVGMNPSKVCAGKECEKTRAFLQYLAMASHGVKGDSASAPSAPAKPKEPKKAEPVAAPKTEAKTSEPAAAASSESKSAGGGGDMNVDDGSKEKTAQMISAIISKPAMKDKLLSRPPFRFLHDVMFNIMKKTNFATDKFDDEEKDAKAMDKKTRLVLLQKVFDLTAQTLGINIDLAPAKVTAGKECEKTRQFLQYFCIAATGNKVGADSAPPAAAPVAAPKKLRPVEQPKRREPEPEPVESKTNNVELPAQPRTQARPTTARRAPPKIAKNAQDMDRKKEFVLEDVGTDGVIMDDDEESESSDDQNDLEEEHTRRSSSKKGKKKNRKQGKLISKIESELEKNETKKKPGKEVKEEKKEKDDGIIIKKNKKSKRLNDTINVDNLRTQIQKLVQSTNPLSKCMDFVNDDLEAMDGEIDKWKSAYRRYSAQLEEEERKTTEQLAPLRKEIDDVEKNVTIVLGKIRECKAKITQNDGKVTEMLRFVVNQK